MECYKDHCEGKTSEYRKSLLEEIKDKIIDNISSEFETYAAINSFSFSHNEGDFCFEDIHEYSREKYTFHFIWCLYAITCGIHLFDENTQKQ